MTTAAAKTTASKASKPAAVSTAIIPAPKGHLQETAKVSDLNTAVAEVVRMKGEAAVSMHALGGKIRDIYERRLWTLRTADDGKAKYKGFDGFCHEELGMTPQNAYSLMDISKHFSESDVRKFGTTKLGLLLTAPKEDQERIRGMIEGGAKKGEVQREVRKAKEEKGHRRPSRDGKVRPAGEKASSAKAKAKKEAITVAKVLGRTTVKLFAKKPDKDGKPVAARKLSDLPWGELELANGVVEVFHVTETPGGELRLVVERKRAAE